MNQEAINLRFDYHKPPNTSVADTHDWIRFKCKALAEFFNELLPEHDGELIRSKALALTALEEAMHWANSCVAKGGTLDANT